MDTVKHFKYDVAISFLQEDEALARELNDLVTERLTTFVYFDRQKEIAGTNGEQTFNNVFAVESRIVVVFYRERWGSTPWTRIEKTAIRNRGYEEGYDFLTMIPLDSPPTVPEWLPKTQIWVGLDRWGVQGAASVIEARVQEAGGCPKQESPVDQAARLSLRKKEEEQRLGLLRSSGVGLADQEVNSLFGHIENIASEINAGDADIKVVWKRVDRETFNLTSWGYRITISWFCPYSNSLTDSGLNVYLLKLERFSAPRERGHNKIAHTQFNFDLRLPDRFGWTRLGDKRFFTSKQLASESAKQLFDRLEQEQPWLRE